MCCVIFRAARPCLALNVRDYFQEVLSCVDVCLPNWSVKHLSIWSEIVETDGITMGKDEVTEMDLEAAEEATAAAKYQEIRSKIALLDFVLFDFFLCSVFLHYGGQSTTCL